MYYMVVYDPFGKMFEVPPRRARFLVIEKGWTFTKPSRRDQD